MRRWITLAITFAAALASGVKGASAQDTSAVSRLSPPAQQSQPLRYPLPSGSAPIRQDNPFWQEAQSMSPTHWGAEGQSEHRIELPPTATRTPPGRFESELEGRAEPAQPARRDQPISFSRTDDGVLWEPKPRGSSAPSPPSMQRTLGGAMGSSSAGGGDFELNPGLPNRQPNGHSDGGRSLLDNPQLESWHEPYAGQAAGPDTLVIPYDAPPSLYEKGYRQLAPVHRGHDFDTGQTFEFETKHERHAPLSEILATGRYFAMEESRWLRPSSSAFNALVVQGPGGSRALPMEFSFEPALGIRAGFESQAGPGIELTYSQFDHNSKSISAVSTGTVSVSSSVDLSGLGTPSILQTQNAGERMTAVHGLEIHTLGASFFKEIRLPKARMNGVLGAQYVSIAQHYRSNLADAGGGVVDRLQQITDWRGLGPRFAFEYYRPIGHTGLEMVGTVGTALLFGHRDHYIENTQQGNYQRIGAREMVAAIDIFAGAQYSHRFAENRSWYARAGAISQIWLGGGHGSAADGDFGLQGFSFSVGLNR